METNMFTEYTLKNVKTRYIDTIKKTVYEAGATAADGQEYMKVSLWQSDWSNVEIKDGVTIRAEMKVTEKNGYKNVNLYPERTKTIRGSGSAPSIKAAQERKAEFIEKAQDRKNESIAFFNATNSAIAIVEKVTKDLPFPTDKDFQQAIVRWRDWFLTEWQKYEAKDLTDKHTAF
jgi:hypothetical protein